jgi:hypothetical protein
MLVVAFTRGELWRLSLAVPCRSRLSLAYVFVGLAGTVTRVTSFIRGAEESVLPVIGKVGGSVDRVNGQLDKVDRITDSAVDAAESVADFQASRDWRHAVRAGKEAAARRELDLADELRNAGT